MEKVKVKFNGAFDLLPHLMHKSDLRQINQTVEGLIDGKIVSFLIKTEVGFFRINQALKTSGASVSKKGYKTKDLAWKYTSKNGSANNMESTMFPTGTINILK